MITKGMSSMSTALVVYESMFGDARDIAEAVAAGLRTRVSTDCVEVGQAPNTIDDGVKLLVVGSPTHATALPRASTRLSAAEKTDEPLVSPGIGVREWLAGLTPPAHSVAGTAFDTRAEHPKIVTTFDHASTTAIHRLRSLGFVQVADPTHYFVLDMTGPLKPGEIERAEQWGRQLTDLLPEE